MFGIKAIFPIDINTSGYGDPDEGASRLKIWMNPSKKAESYLKDGYGKCHQRKHLDCLKEAKG